MKRKTPAKKPRFYQKKGFLWPVGVFVFLLIATLVAFRVSPWPGALVIRAVFNDNGAKMKRAMEAYAPTKPITVVKNQQYRAGDKDALLDVYYPEKTNKKLPVIIWTHGGAWLSGSKSDAAPYFKLLAAKGFTVVAPNYTLAPEKPYPYQISQLNDMHAYVQKEAARLYADTTKIFLAGDSAGSQLSSMLAAIVTNPAYAKEVGIKPNLQPAQLRGLMLNCGIYKMEGLVHPDPTLPKIIGWGDDVSVWAYSGTSDFSDPVIRQMSPYYHVTADFPPVYISGGNADPLTNVQSKPFADKLESHGVDVDRLFYPKGYQPQLEHEYQFVLSNKAGRDALKRTVDFVKKYSR